MLKPFFTLFGVFLVAHSSNVLALEKKEYKELPVFERKVGPYEVIIDCKERSVVYIKMAVPSINTGESSYTIYPVVSDSALPDSCQQKSNSPYPYSSQNLLKFTRGSLISDLYLKDSTLQNTPRYSFNTLPMPELRAKNDAWYQIDERLSCLRSENYPNTKQKLTIMAGPLWEDYGQFGSLGAEPYLDEFGIKIPKALWKMAIKEWNGRVDVNAWLVPNNYPANSSDLNEFLVSPRVIAEQMGSQTILNHIPRSMWDYKPTYSWAYIQNCSS